MNKQTFYSKGSEQALSDDGAKKDAWASCSDGREVWEKYFGFYVTLSYMLRNWPLT